jgi:hypothetical protein
MSAAYFASGAAPKNDRCSFFFDECGINGFAFAATLLL